MRGARLASSARALALSLVAGASLAAPARADVVGVLDPELAHLCGGSAHAPNCRTEHVGMACCAGGFLLVAGLGVGVALTGRKEKQ